MKKYHLLLIVFSFIGSINTIFSCPCMSSNDNPQPFFEESENQNNDQIEEDHAEIEKKSDTNE